jgi:hypothetical protein
MLPHGGIYYYYHLGFIFMAILDDVMCIVQTVFALKALENFSFARSLPRFKGLALSHIHLGLYPFIFRMPPHRDDPPPPPEPTMDQLLRLMMEEDQVD